MKISIIFIWVEMHRVKIRKYHISIGFEVSSKEDKVWVIAWDLRDRNPIEMRYLVIFSTHACGAFFNPYKYFFNIYKIHGVLVSSRINISLTYTQNPCVVDAHN